MKSPKADSCGASPSERMSGLNPATSSRQVLTVSAKPVIISLLRPMNSPTNYHILQSVIVARRHDRIQWCHTVWMEKPPPVISQRASSPLVWTWRAASSTSRRVRSCAGFKVSGTQSGKSTFHRVPRTHSRLRRRLSSETPVPASSSYRFHWRGDSASSCHRL